MMYTYVPTSDVITPFKAHYLDHRNGSVGTVPASYRPKLSPLGMQACRVGSVSIYIFFSIFNKVKTEIKISFARVTWPRVNMRLNRKNGE